MRMTAQQLLDDMNFWKQMEEEWLRQIEPVVDLGTSEKQVKAAWNRFSHRQRAAITRRISAWKPRPEVQDATDSRPESSDVQDCY